MTFSDFSSSNSFSGLWQQLRDQPSDVNIWHQIFARYEQAGLFWQSGYVARQIFRIHPTFAQADVALLGALERQADQQAHALLGCSVDHDQSPAPEVVEALATFCAWVTAYPEDWLTWLYLARLLELVGQNRLAAWPQLGDALQQANGLEPIAGESLHWLGVWRLNSGDAAGAVQAFSQLLHIRPVRCGSMMFLGEALLRTGQRDAAEKAFSRASLSLNVVFLRDLAQRVFKHNYWYEALQILEKAIALQPDSIPTLLAMTTIHWEIYQLSEAEKLCQRILALDPDNREVVFMISALPGRMGDAKKHFLTVQSQFEQLQDPLSRLASSIAMASLYQDDLSAQAVADLHRQLCAPIQAALASEVPRVMAHPRGQRLRLGLVSGDFYRQHPVNLFMLPVLQHLDHERFEVFVYYTGSMHDDYTLMAKSAANHWIDAGKYDDQALCKRIRCDRIDVILDLAGHTSSHRLGLFSMRAAPVQVTFLGYPHSTGLTCMDWLIGDRWVSPAEHHKLFSEGIAQLPSSVFCWAPVDFYPLPPARPHGARVVFGSFNNVMKLSPQTLDLWARILVSVPDSCLLLKAPSFRDQAVINRFCNLFADRHIDPARLAFQGPTELGEMMQSYGEIDIALDPIPYNGGTTSLQALWMGVPLVCLLGDNFVSRMGASFLHNLGREDWLASDANSYVAIAEALAGQVGELRRSRPLFRDQMAASPLCDLDRYVGDFEKLIDRMWYRHYSGSAERFLGSAS